MDKTVKKHPIFSGKHAGLLIPLFSLRSERDWGIGEIDDISRWSDWLAGLGVGILQVLPVNEMPPGQNCPYTALSAFALDPVYISISSVVDVRESGELDEYIESVELACTLKELRKSRNVLYDRVRDLKFRVLWRAFQHFVVAHWDRNDHRARELSGFIKENGYWLEDYSVFRVLKDVKGWKSWTQWEPSLRDHDTGAVGDFARAHSMQVLFFKYLQWILQKQWKISRAEAASRGVRLYGDLPFMVNQESSDVWSRQAEFDLSCSIGAPPDQFSEEGQKWGLPACRWDVMEGSDFRWWRERVRRGGELYDLFRLDHMVGFFRTWIVPYDKSLKPDFDVKEENLQKRRGEKFLRAVLEEASSSAPVAEDLGVIPPFVRETLASFNVPGYKVLRWEKDGEVYRDPAGYPQVSLATTATHDTDTLSQWWDSMSSAERKAVWVMVSGENKGPHFSDRVHNEILRRVMDSGSSLVVLPVQDILGLDDRINTPGTVGEHNWTFRLPVTVEKIYSSAKFKGKIEAFRKIIAESGRAPEVHAEK